MYCKKCGEKIQDDSVICEFCGEEVSSGPVEFKVKRKNRKLAFVLCLLLGWSGIHRVYLDKPISGFLWFFTFGMFCIGWFVDLIMIATGKFKDKNNLPLV